MAVCVIMNVVKTDPVSANSTKIICKWMFECAHKVGTLNQRYDKQYAKQFFNTIYAANQNCTQILIDKFRIRIKKTKSEYKGSL